MKVALAAGMLVTALLGAEERPPAAAAIPNDDKTIVHVLSRIGFGPQPGDLEKVRVVGLQAYIDRQLRPEQLPDGPMEARLSGLATLRLSSREISEQFAQPMMEARHEQQRTEALQPQPGAEPPGMPSPLQQQANRVASIVMTELGAQKMLRAAYSERQLQEVLTDFWFNHFNVDARKGQVRFMLTEYEREAIRPRVLGKFRDLLEATAKSPAMLFYLDNWMSASETVAQDMQMQPPGFGRGQAGRDRSAPPVLPMRPANPQRMPRGLNENYSRELMELHTLGVDGGYTQKDVTEVARALTGWTIHNPRMGGGYAFNPRTHDRGRKVVLGRVIEAGGGGEADGEQVLDILATHASTARFLSTKLARRFVSDTPPPALVDRMAATFRRTDGDLREVMRTLLTSPELFSADAYRAKVKTPFEFVVSAVRASGTEVQDAMPLVRATARLGMPLYQCQPPTGYKDTADAWVNTGALVNRMNFALQLAGNRLRGAANPRAGRVDRQAGLEAGLSDDAAGNDLQVVSRRIIESVLNEDVSAATRDTIAKATTPEHMLALTLGSPEFQRR